jgi:hypothetical protein
MQTLRTIVGLSLLFLASPAVRGEVTVVSEHNNDASATFEFKSIPAPLQNDLAARGKFVLVEGVSDPNGSSLQALNDGRLPEEEDQPTRNFFFNAGDDGGRLRLDLGKPIVIKQVNSYSWHSSDRAPQVYKLYASDGTAGKFNPLPKRPSAPEQCGWKFIANVDTRSQDGQPGGQYGVTIFDTAGALGQYRYFLFDIARTENRDPFGNTFYSEIDIRAMEPSEAEIAVGTKPVQAKDFDYTLDISQTPDLKDWAQNQLRPAIDQWYPILRDCLASDGFTAPRKFSVTIKPMDGVAGTTDTDVEVSADWIRSQLKRPQWNEAIGSIIHELVHVVQQYKTSDTPGYLVEGIADYLRWFHFEPIEHRPTLRTPSRASYSQGYKTTAGFLEYVARNHDHEFVIKLNAALRQGRYSSAIWNDCTGMSVNQLWKEYVQSLAASATAASPDTSEAADSSFHIRSVDHYCEISINTSEAPDLKEWAETKLAPLLAEWYPKLTSMLPSEGYNAPTNFGVNIRPGNGVSATGRGRITANSTWLKGELGGEALGALLHEEVHIVQQYRGRRDNPDYKRPPGWLVEGIPDYIRWFLYEPQSHGADAIYFRTRKNLVLNYDGRYRVSANFLDYVIRNYGKGQDLLAKVNAACRQGRYTDDVWKELTGKSLLELNEEWKTGVQKELEQ